SPFLPWAPQIVSPILNAPFFPGYDWTKNPPEALPPGDNPSNFPLNYTPPTKQPGIASAWSVVHSPNPPSPLLITTNWDHLIYAYLIENTRIFEIFRKVLETYISGEQLETPSPQSQLFCQNLEFLFFGPAMPSMVWTTSGGVRRDEVANRLTTYYRMF